MHHEWNLHYASWIIADGEPDRSIGEVFDWFALAFWTDTRLAVSSEQSTSATAVNDYKYRVVAKVTYLSEKACVLDFGLLATASSDQLPSGCMQGDYVTGEIALDLPLCTTEVMPEPVSETLKYRWQVNRISADLTPYIAHPDHPRFFTRDESRICYQEVPATESVKTHSYILHCCQISS